MLTEANIERIVSSFSGLMPQSCLVAERFYERLFERAPQLKPLFSSEMKAQRKKLQALLARVVGSLRSFDDMRPSLRELGRRHVRYGVHPADYPVVCEVLLEVLAELSDARWTPQTAEAWRDTLELISGVMLDGAAAAA